MAVCTTYNRSDGKRGASCEVCGVNVKGSESQVRTKMWDHLRESHGWIHQPRWVKDNRPVEK